MSLLPQDPAPSSVKLSVQQPSGKSTSVNGKTQARTSGIHQLSIDFNYSLLEFDQRDLLLSFLSEKSGRVVPFEIFVPSHSDNNGIESLEVAENQGTSFVDATRITLKSVDGRLKPFNLISVNGKSKVYTVSNPSEVVDGVQSVTITPPLRSTLVDGDLWNVKNVTVTCTLDDDDLSCSTKGMSSSLKFTALELL